MFDLCRVNMATDNSRSDLLYNKKPAYHSDIVDYYSDYIQPRHIHDDNTSCVLEIAGSSFSLPFDECFLTVTYKIEKKKADGTFGVVEHTLADGNPGSDATLAPVQNILESLFTQYDISVNGKIISENNGIFPYVAHMVKLLNFSKDAKTTYLSLSGWEDDTGGNVDITTTANKGWEKRKNRILNGKEDTVTGVLYSDFAYALSMVPSNADISLILHKSSPEFFLQGGDASKVYRVKIVTLQLETRKYELSPKLNQTIERQLNSNGTVPFTHLSATNYFVPIGSTTFQIPRLVLGQIPLRVIFGVVTNSAFTGDVTKLTN